MKYISFITILLTIYSLTGFSSVIIEKDSTTIQPIITIQDDDPILQKIDLAFIEFCSQSYCENWQDNELINNNIENNLSHSSEDISLRLALLNEKTPINLDYNEYVNAYIIAYTKKHHIKMEKMLGWAEYYYPMFEETLDKYNLPLELKHLAIVESALNPTAKSRSGAMGLWQFMYPTGKMFGLKVNSFYDERCDPILSTEAAAKYLSYLYNMFEDWHLALAAYNCGPGALNKAIRRAGGEKDYWKLRNYLPLETRGYVPAFIAVNYLMNYAEYHNLAAVPPLLHYFETDTLHIQEAVSFQKINEITGVEISHLKILNPSYTKDLIPKVNNKPQVLRLPLVAIGTFQYNDSLIFAKTIEEEKSENAVVAKEEERIIYTVKNGDYLSKIAVNNKCTVNDIKKWNNLNSNYLKVGQKLVIYPKYPVNTASNSHKINDKSTTVSNNSSGSKYKYHTIKSGDTLWDIANSLPGVEVKDLYKWNNFNKNTYKLKPGNKIIIGIDG